MDVIDVLDVDIAWLIGDWECFVGSLSQALRACRLLESPRRPVIASRNCTLSITCFPCGV